MSRWQRDDEHEGRDGPPLAYVQKEATYIRGMRGFDAVAYDKDDHEVHREAIPNGGSLLIVSDAGHSWELLGYAPEWQWG